MKIITLGTSHGAAEKDRFCSSTLIDIGGALYLIDCGAPAEALVERLGYSTKDIKAVFITHMHEDHCGALSGIYKKFCVYHREYSCEAFFPEKAGIDAFKVWLTGLHSKPDAQTSFRFNLITEGEFYKDENVVVSAQRTYHLGQDFPSYSFMLEAEGKRIVFTGDMGHNFKDFPSHAINNHCDLVVSEFTHFNPQDIEFAAKNIAQANADRIVFSHVQNGKSEPIMEHQNLFSCPIEIANDGDVFEI